ncbi:hypothetical protein VN12_14555 [Pirellula sp. SH-Sr6A]|nr:hypothetical protein VN12_14555 [Pirellula sp. SH-Sr6A]
MRNVRPAWRWDFRFAFEGTKTANDQQLLAINACSVPQRSGANERTESVWGRPAAEFDFALRPECIIDAYPTLNVLQNLARRRKTNPKHVGDDGPATRRPGVETWRLQGAVGDLTRSARAFRSCESEKSGRRA